MTHQPIPLSPTLKLALALLCIAPALVPSQAGAARGDGDGGASARRCNREEVAATVAALDTQYQRAVKENDADTMDRILADDFALVVGRGHVFNKADLLKDARDGGTTYEHQEDSERTVRVLNCQTAVVTALLWSKNTSGGATSENKLWFSDVYLRTRHGWRYVFAQASLPLPK